MLKDALAGGVDIRSPQVPRSTFEEKNDMRTTLVAATAFALAIGGVPAAWAQGAAPADGTNVGAMLAQAKTPEGKKALVASSLALTDAEAKKFWPVYDAHQAALSEFNRRRLDNILAYARVWNTGKVDDAAATALAKEAIAIEKQEAAQLERTFGKLKRAVPAVKAVRYLQVEAKLRAIVRFEQAAQVPFVPGA